MSPRSFCVLASCAALALLSACPTARAEQWPTLEEYVGKCVLIVKAKTVVEHDGKLSFQVLESWKGKYDPQEFVRTTAEGRFFANKDEHGVVNVAQGQEIVSSSPATTSRPTESWSPTAPLFP